MRAGLKQDIDTWTRETDPRGILHRKPSIFWWAQVANLEPPELDIL